MGSGHILVYAFDVLMQIYESCGYSQRDAAKSILIYNIYGLDIDNRAYQLAYFALMMKARQYNRRILDGETDCHVYSIQESNGINLDHLKYFGAGMSEIERNIALPQLKDLLDTFVDAKEYGSILYVKNYNWELLYRFVGNVDLTGQLTLDAMGIEDTKEQLRIFVEVGATMAQKYDVVVTNPPYMGGGGMNTKLSEYAKNNYPYTKTDMSTIFMEKTVDIIKAHGMMAMINIPVWMFLSTYETMRENIIAQSTIVNMLHLGRGIFGSDFGTTTFVIRKGRNVAYVAQYRKLFMKQGAVDSIQEKESMFFDGIGKYKASQKVFETISGKPIAYWVSSACLKAFLNGRKLSDVAATKQGLKTGDNDKFLRLWPEISFQKISINGGGKWYPCNKGGDYRRWYGNNEYVINWENDGYELKNHYDENGRLKSRPQNLQYMFKKGLTYTNISSSKFGVRYCPEGFIFDAAGSMIFTEEDRLEYLLGFLSSNVVLVYTQIFSPTMTFEVGQINQLPIVFCPSLTINELVKINISIAKQEWDSFETSWDFLNHPLVGDTVIIADAFDQWQRFTEKQFNQLKSNEEKLNRIFINIYNLQNELIQDVEDKDVTFRKANLGRDIRSFVSYAVGCMLGRYSLDEFGIAYAGGQWDDSKYSTFIPDKDNILPITDEEYFEDDIVGLFVAFVKKIYGKDTLEQNLDFIAKALGNKGNTSREIIRNYFVKDFFKDHCKVYQKRPIYWLFDSGKVDGFKALVYMHRYDENTIGNLRIDYLHRMQRIYESEIARMQDTIENSTNAREVTAAEKRKEKLTKQLKETKEYDAKIAHLALARIAIDLDDGVAVNYEKVQTDTEGKKLEVLARI